MFDMLDRLYQENDRRFERDEEEHYGNVRETLLMEIVLTFDVEHVQHQWRRLVTEE